jgi:deoxyribodipyrimidine photo-lyase
MWFRRDLRLHDNAALYHALTDCDRVYCSFCFDREFLDELEDRRDRRIEFIRQSLAEMEAALAKRHVRLIVRHGFAREQIPKLAAELGVSAVYANHDYEPKCRVRDAAVERKLASGGRGLRTFKDHVIFEKDEVLDKACKPYRVYTHYRNAWRAALTEESYQPYPCEPHFRKLANPPAKVRSHPWRLGDLGFAKADLRWPGGTKAAHRRFDRFLAKIEAYLRARDCPGAEATSHLSVHLRFGTISIREVVREAIDHDSPGAQKWIDELVWREFYNMILYHFPRTEDHAFQPALDTLPWRRDGKAFSAWCDGLTGYPVVDAGMRQLNSTGYMHNRLRMITASFLTKDLLIDWKWGERYFARELLDYDLSQNLGGWQWSASIGTDAQPYFRIFNPVTQSQRFDPDGEFIRRYIPELAKYPPDLIHAPWQADPADQHAYRCIIGRDYPAPIVDHAEARKTAIEMFRQARKARSG